MKEKINITVLVAPLDWGLGHATRCIPVIWHLLFLKCRVILAADGPQAKLLSAEFPELELLPLKGYGVSYSASKRWFAFKILKQLPNILNAIEYEHSWLKKTVEEKQVDLVISDNRYGMYHNRVPSIIITHQLRVKAPLSWMEGAIQRVVFKYINRFSACWIVDAQGDINLGGKLSHPGEMPATRADYLGPLSRFELEENTEDIDVLILLSGPEPQRSLLENLLISQLPLAGKFIYLVRGLPAATTTLNIPGVHVINHLPAQQLQTLVSRSKLVVCRSGYSTIMDLCKLQKKSILIPTPGQTEQEYLAKYLSEKGWCISFSQSHFDLETAINKTTATSFSFPPISFEAFKPVIEKFVDDLQRSL